MVVEPAATASAEAAITAKTRFNIGSSPSRHLIVARHVGVAAALLRAILIVLPPMREIKPALPGPTV